MVNNEDAASGLVPGLMVFIIIVAGAVGFLMLTDAFDTQYTAASIDPVNNTGILLNNTSAYTAVKTTSETITSNLPVGILIAFLFVVIVFVMLVYAILKKGGD